MWKAKSWNEFFKNRPRIAYPRTNIDMILNAIKYPKFTNPIPDFFGVCVDECPLAGEVVCSYEAGLRPQNFVRKIMVQQPIKKRAKKIYGQRRIYLLMEHPTHLKRVKT
jgi:hypothetical protein